MMQHIALLQRQVFRPAGEQAYSLVSALHMLRAIYKGLSGQGFCCLCFWDKRQILPNQRQHRNDSHSAAWRVTTPSQHDSQ